MLKNFFILFHDFLSQHNTRFALHVGLNQCFSSASRPGSHGVNTSQVAFTVPANKHNTRCYCKVNTFIQRTSSLKEGEM